MLTKLLDVNTFINNQEPVVFFTATSYPFNFFKLFFNFLNKHHKIRVTNLYINTLADWQACLPSLEMSFLGQKSYFWLHELGLDSKNKQIVYKYLINYSGPHNILIFVNNDDSHVISPSKKSMLNLDLKTSKDLTSLVR